MKNLKIIFLSILLIFVFSACSLMPSSNTYIQIYDCMHGSLEVEIKEKSYDDTEFYIYVYPEEGYELDADNIFVIDHEKAAHFWSEDEARINCFKTNNKNIYTFSVSTNSKISITAFFTKIEQE